MLTKIFSSKKKQKNLALRILWVVNYGWIFGLRFLLYCFNGSQQLEVGKWGGGGGTYVIYDNDWSLSTFNLKVI